MKLTFFNLFLFVIIIVKILFIFSLLKLFYIQMKFPENYIKISKQKKIKNEIDWYFLTLSFLLIIYLFNPFYERQMAITSHVKLLLFTFGIVGLIDKLRNH